MLVTTIGGTRVLSGITAVGISGGFGVAVGRATVAMTTGVFVGFGKGVFVAGGIGVLVGS